jgi:uncharacterized protein (TIGR02246 family)
MKDQDEKQIKALCDHVASAIRTRNLDQMMSAYAEDVIQFDVTGALAQHGAAEVRKATRAWFDGWERGIDFEVRDLTIEVAGDVAFAHSFNRSAGTSKQGSDVAMWVRWTACFRKRDGAWKVVHEHVSVPFDVKTMKPELALEPRAANDRRN